VGRVDAFRSVRFFDIVKNEGGNRAVGRLIEFVATFAGIPTKLYGKIYH
jgi:hypothetical protein